MKLNLLLGQLCPPKTIKFLTAGMLNTIFGYAIYAALLFAGISYHIALILATIAGITFNYFSFGYIVFNGGRGWLIFCKFTISYLVIYGLNALGLSALIKYFFVNPYLGQIICILPGVLLSWWLMNCWVFRDYRDEEKKAN
jgi:putative flippase GtrA